MRKLGMRNMNALVLEDGRGLYLAKTLTTPSPPALTTHRPSWLQTTEHTPSPRIMRWLVISCMQLLLSRDQKRRLASWPAETSSRPSGERDKDDMAEGCASMVYVHWPVSVSMSLRRRWAGGGIPLLASKNLI